ncbi:YtxH domain-containing protein [Flavobacterium petrolei]|jgi:gas vesicle protein|uniref:YtxH domain-containing protein n=1 Tax=Flavobacterium petrolei TaxID=2259594 RepID=A0A482TLW7_9FLAO|nr:YtxH domain-containing protein [Flavobacterium petrolei]RYJ52518.1 YtxH domain-containing protein [Flavobacterium petrolei]
MKNNNIALGILGGLAVGAVLGILFAPAKGCETRKKIVDKSTDLAESLKDSSDKLSNVISQTINDLKNESQQLLGNTKEVIKAEIANADNLKNINKPTL